MFNFGFPGIIEQKTRTGWILLMHFDEIINGGWILLMHFDTK